MKDDRAARMGPILAPIDDHSSLVVDKVKADESRLWAVNQIDSVVGREPLIRHLACLVHCWTADGQRFFLRFADGRSMRAVWSALNARQRSRVLGPLHRWRTTGRDGRPVDWVPPSANTPGANNEPAPFRLRLSDAQVDQVLAQSWPDQLLSAVLDEAPTLSDGITAQRLHELASQACAWLRQMGEERYPEQKACLAHVLRHGGGGWVDPPWPGKQ